MTIAKGPLRVTVRDVAWGGGVFGGGVFGGGVSGGGVFGGGVSGGGVESLAAATARTWAETNRGYAEQALYPVTVLGVRGLERRFEIDGDRGPERCAERYAVVEGRSIVISGPEHLRHIMDGIDRRPSYSPVPGRFELLLSVEVPRGWTVNEELVVVRRESGQQARAESEVLPAEMTADDWIAVQVTKADQVPGYARVNASYTTFLGDLPATLVTYQQYAAVGHPLSDPYVRRLWLGVVDGVGYRVTTVSSYHEQGVGTFAAYGGVAAHLTLADRPPASDLLVRAGAAINNKLAGIRRFWRDVAPQPQ